MPILRSVFLKFLAIQVPIFLLLMATGLHLLSEYRIRVSQEQMGARIGMLAGRVASMLADVDAGADAGAANQLISILMSDRGVACVEFIADGRAVSGISAPRMVGCKGAKAAQFTTIAIAGDAAQELRIGLSTEEIEQIRKEARDFGWVIAAASLLLAATAGGAGFRSVVSRRLDRLLAAIRQLGETGRYTHVETRSHDEIGTVIRAFNRMQDALATERERVEGTVQKLDRLYNKTPALLFTMDDQGVVMGVSEYWLAATGFRRNDIAGRSFELCLSISSRRHFKRDLMPNLIAGGLVREVPLEVVRHDGSCADMLFSVVQSEANGVALPEYVCVMSDVTQLRLAEKELRDVALTDYLTKLPNRFGMNERMQQLAGMARAARGVCAVMLIDLDNFKWVNDTFGHEAGDQLLIAASQRISAVVRPADMVIRLGGDEFAIICAQLVDVGEARTIAGRVVDAFAAGIPLGDNIGYVSASVGISMASDDHFTPACLIRQADQAMYAAKLEGKNRFAVFSSSHQRDEDAKGFMLEKIKHGLDHDEFRLHFQPLIALNGMRAAGVEALLRLPSSNSSFESIEHLIRVAEEAGMMERLGGWVLKSAIDQFVATPAFIDEPDFYLTVNVSTRQLSHDFAERVAALMAETPRMKGRLVLEITETAAIKRFDLVCELLVSIRACGVRIAIDDFGVGYSSLSYISRLPVDMIKLDRQLVQSLAPASTVSTEMRKNRALVRTVATLASELQVPLVAEGVETIEISDMLAEIGVPFAQGYLFARPMPVSEAASWVAIFRRPKGADADVVDMRAA